MPGLADGAAYFRGAPAEPARRLESGLSMLVLVTDVIALLGVATV